MYLHSLCLCTTLSKKIKTPPKPRNALRITGPCRGKLPAHAICGNLAVQSNKQTRIQTSTLNEFSVDRNCLIGPRNWIRVGLRAAHGRAPDDAVFGDLEVDVLHADCVVAVRSLGGVGDVGSAAVGVARAAQVAVDLDVPLRTPDGVAEFVGVRASTGGNESAVL